jgi:hypothetical protein
VERPETGQGRENRVDAMFRMMSAIATAGFLAAAITVLLPGFSPEVEASAPAPVAKSDRLATLSGDTGCITQGWPYYETSCLRDRSRKAGRATPVRLVTTDRVAMADPFTDANLLPDWPQHLAALQVSLPRMR